MVSNVKCRTPCCFYLQPTRPALTPSFNEEGGNSGGEKGGNCGGEEGGEENEEGDNSGEEEGGNSGEDGGEDEEGKLIASMNVGQHMNFPDTDSKP